MRCRLLELRDSDILSVEWPCSISGMQTSALQCPPHFSAAAIDLLQSLLLVISPDEWVRRMVSQVFPGTPETLSLAHSSQ